MTNRGLALAIVAFIGLTHMANAEIVVLVNGNRMDVKSYDIQSSVVIVTTWDGKVQSFPIAWIDVEATKNVSHQYDPTAGIPPARLQQSRVLLEQYGVRLGVSTLFDQLEVEIRSMRSIIGRPNYEVVQGAFRSAYDGDRIFDVVVADFAKHVDDALLDRWSQWMSLPTTERIVAMENAELSDDDEIDKSRYLAELYSDPTTEYRRDLVERLDQAVHASRAGLEIAVALSISVRDSGRLVLPNPPPYRDDEQLRERVWPAVRKATRDNLLFTYRWASNEELEAYVAYWESSDGQLIANELAAALGTGAQYGAEMAVHNVAAGTGGTLEEK